MLFDGSQHRHAELAALQWGGSDLEHLQTSGNAVYRMTRRGEPVILRLGHPRHRSAEHDRAEVEFVAHLERCAVPVAAPIAADDGRLVLASGEYSATAFRWAPGRCVGPRDPEWGEPLVREWGRVLGMIHRAALTHEPPGAPRRWHWADEYLWREA
ncbi:MAG: phosphotransferase, partial [Planctomycetota bacterium]|nr:phosphotransferase [Planctomycetota bacterium]